MRQVMGQRGRRPRHAPQGGWRGGTITWERGFQGQLAPRERCKGTTVGLVASFELEAAVVASMAILVMMVVMMVVVMMVVVTSVVMLLVSRVAPTRQVAPTAGGRKSQESLQLWPT